MPKVRRRSAPPGQDRRGPAGNGGLRKGPARQPYPASPGPSGSGPSGVETGEWQQSPSPSRNTRVLTAPDRAAARAAMHSLPDNVEHFSPGRPAADGWQRGRHEPGLGDRLPQRPRPGSIRQEGPLRRDGHGSPHSVRRKGRRSFGRFSQRDSERYRRWQRFYRGLRRDMGRSQHLILFSVLSLMVLIVYGLYANGAFGRAGGALRQAGEVALTSAGVRLAEITIGGRTMVPEQTIINALGAEVGMPLIDFDVIEARRRVEDMPWISSAQVTRLLPDRIHVQIVEREAFAVWQNQGQFILIDRDGNQLEVLDRAGAVRFGHLPFVVGPGAQRDAGRLIGVLSLYPVLGSRLVAASRVGERRWTLRLDNGMEIRLPDRNVREALSYIAELDAEHRLLARPISVIDLRNPDMLIIRPNETAQAAGAISVPSGGRRVAVE